MSYKTMDWACNQELPVHQKIALIMLAWRKNDVTGRCDPGMDTIAKDCGMSDASVKRSLRELVKRGLIKREQRKIGTINLSNAYVLNSSDVGSIGPQGGVCENPGVGSIGPQGGVCENPGVGSIGPPNTGSKQGKEHTDNKAGVSDRKNETPKPTAKLAVVPPTPKDAAEVKAVRLAYPRKVAIPQAEKAIRAACVVLGRGGEMADGTPLSPMEGSDAMNFLLTQAKAYADHPATRKQMREDPSKVPYPATWFNAGRYLETWVRSTSVPEDELSPSELAKLQRSA